MSNNTIWLIWAGSPIPKQRDKLNTHKTLRNKVTIATY